MDGFHLGLFFHPFPSIVIGALVYGAISRLEAFKAPT